MLPRLGHTPGQGPCAVNRLAQPLPRTVHQHPQIARAHTELAADGGSLHAQQLTHHESLPLHRRQGIATAAHQIDKLPLAAGLLRIAPGIGATGPGPRAVPGGKVGGVVEHQIARRCFAALTAQLVHQLVAQHPVHPGGAVGIGHERRARLQCSQHRFGNSVFGQRGAAHARPGVLQQRREQARTVERSGGVGNRFRADGVLHARTIESAGA